MGSPFSHFKPTSPDGLKEFRVTQYTALAPLYVSLVLMGVQPQAPGPGLWFVFVFSAGMSTLLCGVERLCFEKSYCTAWAHNRAQRCDAWLPWVVFIARCASIGLTASVFWTFAVRHGIPATIWQHINFVATLGGFFIYQWLEAVAGQLEEEPWQNAAELARYGVFALVALLVGSIVTLLVAPPGERIPADQQIFIALLWIGVLLVPLVCALLWASHVISRRQHATRRA